MKILYDNQIFSTQRFGGISRYYYELIKILSQEIECDLPVAFSNNHYIKDKDITSHRTFFSHKKICGTNLFYQIFQ